MELANEIIILSVCLLLTQTVILMAISSEARSHGEQANIADTNHPKQSPDTGEVVSEHIGHKTERVKRSSDVEEFFQEEENQATFIVLPVLVLVYGGCSSIYCIYKCRKYFKRKHSNEFKNGSCEKKSDYIDSDKATNEDIKLTSDDSQPSIGTISSITKPKLTQSEDYFIEDIEMVSLDDFITMAEENFHGKDSQKIQNVSKPENARRKEKLPYSSGYMYSKNNISPVNGINGTGTPVSIVSEIFVASEGSSYSSQLGTNKVPHMPDIIPADDENSKRIIKCKTASAKIYSA